MFEYFNKLYESTDFMPHGDCLVWNPILLWKHVGSDIVTGIAYYLIAATLAYFISKRRDLPFLWIFVLFVAFILSCGTTHLFAAWTIYYPSYWIEGDVKVVNAIISLGTALVLVPMMPKLLALPSLRMALDKVALLNEKLEQKVVSLKDVITRRQKSEEALKESEEALKKSQAFQEKMVANIGDVIVVIDQEGINRYKSPNIEKWFGWKPQDVLGCSALDNVHPDDKEHAAQFIENLFGQPDKTHTTECRYLCKDGNYKWIEFVGTNLLHDPEINGILGNYRDITDRKRSKDTFQAIVESTVGKTGKEFFKNICTQLCNVLSADCAIVGELVDAKTVNTLAMILEGKFIENYSYNLEGTPCARVIDDGFCHYPKDVYNLFPNDGDLQGMKAVGYVGNIMKDHNEKPIGLLCILSKQEMILPEGAEQFMSIIAARASAEIERIREEREKDALANRLQQAQKMEAVGTLAGGIAHDFNNILGVILGYADMAKEDAPPGSKFASDLDRVVTAGNRAKDLVAQILAFSRQAEVERIPLQLQSLVKEAVKMLRASIPTTIEIEESIDSTCGMVLADPTQVHQILMNLCTNANHAMEKSGGILRIQLRNVDVGEDLADRKPALRPGRYVELIVSDTGVGIKPDIIEKIFDPYFTTKELGKGTGMGLAIIHGIISEYEGAVTVESELGQGTTFHVYFPTVDGIEHQPNLKDEDIPAGKGRILFIDDEDLLVEMGKDMLERLGYDVTVRQNSVDALSTFQNNPDAFDVVITDQTMPGMTGADLSRRILQIRPDIPIILCTGYSNLIDEFSAKSMGIREFALKPLSKGSIAKLLQKVLGPEKS